MAAIYVVPGTWFAVSVIEFFFPRAEKGVQNSNIFIKIMSTLSFRLLLLLLLLL